MLITDTVVEEKTTWASWVSKEKISKRRYGFSVVRVTMFKLMQVHAFGPGHVNNKKSPDAALPEWGNEEKSQVASKTMYN